MVRPSSASEAECRGLPSPALHAGIVPGDIIVEINGVPNNDLGSFGLQPFQGDQHHSLE